MDDFVDHWSELAQLHSEMNNFVIRKVIIWMTRGYKQHVVKSIQMNVENWKTQISSLSAGSSLLNYDQYLTIVRILETMQDFRGIFEVADPFAPKADITPTSADSVGEFHEIRDLKDNEDSIINAISNLSFKYGKYSDTPKRLLSYSLLVLSKFALGNNSKLTQKRVHMTVRVLQGYNHQSRCLDVIFGDFLDGCFETEGLSPTTAKIVPLFAENWAFGFVVRMILADCCSLDTIINRFVYPGIASTAVGHSPLWFTDMGPEQFSRLALLIRIVHFLLSAGTPGRIDSDIEFSEVDLHTLSALRAAFASNASVMTSLFDVLLKLWIFFQDTGARNLPLLEDSHGFLSEIFESILSSDSLFLMSFGANVDTLCKTVISSWIQDQHRIAAEIPKISADELAKSHLRRICCGFEFFRAVFKVFVGETSAERLADISLQRATLESSFHRLLEDTQSLRDQHRPVGAWLMFEQINLVEALLGSSRAENSDISASAKFSDLADVFVDFYYRDGRINRNSAFRLIPEFPTALITHILSRTADTLEKALSEMVTPSSAVQCDIGNIAEICCVAAKVTGDRIAEGREGPYFIERYIKVYFSIVRQLEWFLKQKDLISQIETSKSKPPPRSSENGLRAPDFLASMDDGAYLAEMRRNLLLRLKVLSSFMPFVTTNLEKVNSLHLVRLLIVLSVSNLVQNSDFPIGDQVLDFAVYVLEAPDSQKYPDLRGVKLTQAGVIAGFATEFDNKYTDNLLVVAGAANSGATSAGVFSAAGLFEPFRWIERRSYSLAPEAGDAADEDRRDGEAAVGNSGSGVASSNMRVNDTPLTLALFGATVAIQPAARLPDRLARAGWSRRETDDDTAGAAGQALFENMLKHSRK
ncbi:hypothetical protein HDU84_006895 [Entophlyctis sp. JEL0112]|nr:hypothetical protein HDU84_006895 [Entophlyctis sp. JEL0112]